MAGSVLIRDVSGISTVVDITTVGGSPTELPVFSDKALTQAVTLPVTITADTTFYLAVTGGVLLSVKVNGTEIAGPLEVFLTNAGPVAFSLDNDPRNTDAERLMGLRTAASSAPLGRWCGYADAVTLTAPPVGNQFLFTSAPLLDQGAVITAPPAGEGGFTIDDVGGTYIFEVSLVGFSLAGIGEVFANVQVVGGVAQNQLSAGDGCVAQFIKEVSTGTNYRQSQHTSSPIECEAGASVVINIDLTGSAWTGGGASLLFTATKVALPATP